MRKIPRSLILASALALILGACSTELLRQLEKLDKSPAPSPLVPPTPVPTATPSPSAPVALPMATPQSTPLLTPLPVGENPVYSRRVTSDFVMAPLPLETSANGALLKLSLNRVKPRKPIPITFQVPPSLPKNAWIGIIPSEIPHGDETVNDTHDVSYQYLEGKTSATLDFQAPDKEGKYDFRLHDTDNNGKELAAIPFVVTRELPPEELHASKMSLPWGRFKPGKEVALTFSAPATFDKNAWIGIVPSKIEHGEESRNDENALSYQYLEGKTEGTLTFQIPTQEGNFDFRMHDTDNNGKEAAYLSFIVSRDLTEKELKTASLLLDVKVYKPGESITVRFSAPDTFEGNGWIGIVPAEIPHGEESVNDAHNLSYQYLEGRTAGEFKFSAPTQPGRFDIRMHDTDSNGKEAASVSFQVVEETR